MDKVSATLAASERKDGKLVITFRDFVTTMIRVFVAQGEVQ